MRQIIMISLLMSSLCIFSEENNFIELLNFSWSVHYKDVYGDPLKDVDLILTFDKENQLTTASETMNKKTYVTQYKYYFKNKFHLWIYYDNPDLPRFIIEKTTNGWIIYSPNTHSYDLKELTKMSNESK